MPCHAIRPCHEVMRPHAFHGWITRIGFSLEGVLKGFSRVFKFGWVYLKGFTHKFVSKVKDLGILKGLEGAQGSCMASWGMRQGLETGINMILNIVSPRLEIRIALRPNSARRLQLTRCLRRWGLGASIAMADRDTRRFQGL